MSPDPRQLVEQLEPVPTLLGRVREELSVSFTPGRPIRVSRAPETLDVMGGGCDYAGTLVCAAALDRGAAVALQARDDREVQVFSFNGFDEHVPFTLRISLDALAGLTADDLRRGFNEPGRRWAAGVVGCFSVLHERGRVDLRNPNLKGVNLAIYSTAPARIGVGSPAAAGVATMVNLRDHFGLGDRVDAVTVADLCRTVEEQIVGIPSGIADALSSLLADPNVLTRFRCQPYQPQPPLALPDGIRVLGFSDLGHARVRDAQYPRTRSAAFMGHRILLEKMRHIGRLAGRPLERDPMGSCLADLDPADYRKYFRPHLPETVKGGEFLLRYGGTVDPTTKIEPDHVYPVRDVTDHHVFESERARSFVKVLEAAGVFHGAEREALLREAGRLMYESHDSVMSEKLGWRSTAFPVDVVREIASPAIYGARVAAHGSGGMVALLAASGPKSDARLAEFLEAYRARVGHPAHLFACTTPGAWHTGTVIV